MATRRQWLAVAVVCLCVVVVADEALSPRTIYLLSGDIDTSAARSPLVRHASSRALDEGGRFDQYLVHLSAPITERKKARVNALLSPHSLGQYLPENTFIVVAPASTVEGLETSSTDVLWVGHLPTAARVHPFLRDRANKISVRKEGETQEPVVLRANLPEVYSLEQAQEIARHWQLAVAAVDSAVVVAAASDSRIMITVTNSASVQPVIDIVAAQPEAHWIDEKPKMMTRNYYASAYIQGGTVPSSSATRSTPFWDLGLNGTGQILGIGDTGIDMSHCFFKDPNVATPINTVNMAHRKVVTYIAYADSSDSDSASGGGHGSHTSGTLAGQTSRAGVCNGNGMAPGAKLAFTDIANGNAEYLSLPNDLNADYFPGPYNAGARIHSNSWGSTNVNNDHSVSAAYYSSDDRDFDKFSASKLDFLPLVAAGNDGEYGDGTVASPGLSKNALTVGAAMSRQESWLAYCATPAGANYVSCSTVSANSVAFSANSMAYFSSRGLPSDGRQKPDLTATGFFTWSAASNGDNAADPCDSGASSALFFNAGTSMATPTVAGNLAILRQYFTDGWYPTGSRVPSNGFNPSASLMRALAINGAQPMSGNVVKNMFSNGPDVALGPLATPNKYEGYGRFQLDKSLYLPSLSTSVRTAILSLTASNTDPSVTTGVTREFCFTTMPFRGTWPALKFTMVFTDPAGSSGSRTPWVNDLDLAVVDSTGAKTTNPSNKNNIEQLTIATPRQYDQYCAQVKGTSVPTGPQTFSLVVSGPVPNVNPLYAPVAPDTPLISTSGCAVTLEWSGYASTVAYNLQKSEAGGAWSTVLAFSSLNNGTMYTDTSSPGVISAYRLRSMTTDAVSNFTASAATTGSPITTPVATVQTLSSTALRLTWTSSGGCAKYSLQGRVQGTSTWNMLTSTPLLTADVTGLNSGTAMEFRVAGTSYDQVSSYSDVVVGSTLAASPGVPPNLRITDSQLTSVALAWDAATPNGSPILFYIIQAQVNSVWSLVGTTPALTYTATDLQSNLVYSFRVAAANAYGNSSMSASVATITNPDGPQCPARTLASPGVGCDAASPNTVCTPTCSAGYAVSTMLAGTCIRGATTSTWQPTPSVSCTPRSCATLNTTAVGAGVATGTCTVRSYGSTCTATCASGYTLSGSGTMVCVAVGDGVAWQGAQTLVCTAITCPALITLPAGATGGTCTQRILGSTCQLACLPGYTASAVNTGTCLTVAGNSTWRNAGITCTPPPTTTAAPSTTGGVASSGPGSGTGDAIVTSGTGPADQQGGLSSAATISVSIVIPLIILGSIALMCYILMRRKKADKAAGTANQPGSTDMEEVLTGRPAPVLDIPATSTAPSTTTPSGAPVPSKSGRVYLSRVNAATLAKENDKPAASTPATTIASTPDVKKADDAKDSKAVRREGSKPDAPGAAREDVSPTASPAWVGKETDDTRSDASRTESRTDTTAPRSTDTTAVARSPASTVQRTPATPSQPVARRHSDDDSSSSSSDQKKTALAKKTPARDDFSASESNSNDSYERSV